MRAWTGSDYAEDRIYRNEQRGDFNMRQVTDEELRTGTSDTLESVRAERDRLRAELSARLAARDRTFSAFGHKAVRDKEGKCLCPYCTRDADALAEISGEYELQLHGEATRRKAAEQGRKKEKMRALQLHRLVGCVIEALEGYDSDDGANELVLAGIVAEFRRITGEYDEPASADAVDPGDGIVEG